MPPGSNENQPRPVFRDQVFRAGKWAIGLQAADRLLGLIRTVVLARLLAPDDIGLFAIAAMALQLLATFSITGFNSALIHKQDVERGDLDAAWTVHVIRGFLRAAVLWLAAPFVADFYHAPMVTFLMRMISLMLVLEGFRNIGTVHFSKELQYNKVFLLSLSGTVADLVTVVIAALILRNAWALAYGFLARHATYLVMSYLIHPFRPRFRLVIHTLKPLFRYGMWVSLTGILFFVGRQVAGLVLGKVGSVEALGFYQMALMITQAAILDPVLAVGDVAFPALSMVQDTPERFRFSALTLIGLSVAVVMPLCVFVFLAADDITLTLFGAAWMPIVPALRVLCLALTVTAMASAGTPILMGSGLPSDVFKSQLFRALGVLATVYPLVALGGAVGAAVSVLCGGCGMMVVSGYYIQRTIGLRREEFIGLFLPPLLACGAAAFAYGLASIALRGADAVYLAWPPVSLCLKAGAGAAAFFPVYRFCQAFNPTGIDYKILLAAVWQKKA